jgi:hypothetical protein
MAFRAGHRREAAMIDCRRGVRFLLGSACLLVAACAGPPPADWKLNSKAAIDRSVAAYLSGDSALAAREFELGRSEVARTGQIDLLARLELVRCAARVASLEFDGCEGFEKLRPQAAAPERAYADFLAARLQPQDLSLLPPSQKAAASANPDAAPVALQAIDDPFSRLVAAGVLFESGRANPAAMSLAVDTASAQGWRRPLLAWLKVQALRAEKSGAWDEAERLRKRIGLVQGSN